MGQSQGAAQGAARGAATAVKPRQIEIEELKEVSLTGVVPIGQELGKGAYGRVFTVMYRGEKCAAKEIHPVLIADDVSVKERKTVKDDFVKECLRCSSIRHQNIVEFKGVYYSSTSLPIMVMELMACSLNWFIENNQSNIGMKTKLSILYDVSNGLNFLHTRNPIVIHRDLSSKNVMLTSKLVAKIGDLGVAKVVKADSTKRTKLTTAPGTPHFMPPEALDEIDPIYSTPVDVFSFAGIALHVFSEEWPTPSGTKIRDPHTNEIVSLSEADRRQKYLNKMTGKAAELKPLIKRCLDDDPNKRPSIGHVNDKLLEPPPLANALYTKLYHLKWEKCADLPSRMYLASVAVSDNCIYVTAGGAPEDGTYNNVYCYDLMTEQWSTLSSCGHRCGVLCIVNNNLSIFGGYDSVTHKRHSKVSTYNWYTKTWTGYYPNMIQKRLLPGVVTHGDHMIVMGGECDCNVDLDSIEIMNWQRRSPWIKTSTKLPVPMWAIKPTIAGQHILIVGYSTTRGRYNKSYQLPVSNITSLLTPSNQVASLNQVASQWKELSPATHWDTVTVPCSNPPLIIGGDDDTSTSVICMYNTEKKLWLQVDSLSSARCNVGVASINSNTIIVIGGTTGGVGFEANMASSLSIVEIGHVVRYRSLVTS